MRTPSKIGFLLSAFWYSACLPTPAGDEGPSKRHDVVQERKLSCPDSSPDAFCFLFNDGSVAALSFTAATSPTLSGNFRTGSYSIPVTGVVDGDRYSFSFCSPKATYGFPLESGITISSADGAMRNATLSFKIRWVKGSEVSVHAKAYAIRDFPATTTSPLEPSATGHWLLYATPQTAVPVYIATHNALLLWGYESAEPCSFYYGRLKDAHHYTITTGTEWVPDVYASVGGTFADDFTSGTLTTSSSNIAGQSSSETRKLKRR